MSPRWGLRPAARADIEQLTEFSIARWGTERTAAYLQAILTAFERIAENPGIGSDRSVILPGLRKLAVGSHAIFYFAEGDRVRITRLLHASRDVATAFDAPLPP